MSIVNGLPFGGGMSETILWSNSNPTATFAAQTVTLSQPASDFKYLRIVWNRGGNSTTKKEYKISQDYPMDNKTLNVGEDNSNFGACQRIAEWSSYYGRYAWFPNNNYNSVQFATAYDCNKVGSNNGALIPVAIYGLK